MSQRPTPSHQLSTSSVGQMKAFMMLKRLRRIYHPTREAAGKFLFFQCKARGGTLARIERAERVCIATASVDRDLEVEPVELMLEGEYRLGKMKPEDNVKTKYWRDVCFPDRIQLQEEDGGRLRTRHDEPATSC